MAEPLAPVLAQLRSLILDDGGLVRAVASGRHKGRPPQWRRAEMRYVDLDSGRHLQVTVYDETQAHAANHVGNEVAGAIDALLDQPFAHWRVETVTAIHQVRVTKRGEALVHIEPRPSVVEVTREHDRRKPRLLAEDDTVLRAVGISDDSGRVKPSRQAKYRQVEEFLRSLAPLVDDAISSGLLRRPDPEHPLRVADLGCGNAYLTFAAHRYLSGVLGLDVDLVGVDSKEQSYRRNAAIVASLGLTGSMRFVLGEISSAAIEPPPEIVLALHACDTATDEALARAVEWGASLILAAPCCHHDVAAQLGRAPAAPAPYALIARHGILRQRFADTLTDAVRAAVLRLLGYRVDVIEFVESKHTPRNTMLRAVRTGARPPDDLRGQLDDLTTAWGVQPALAALLPSRLGPGRSIES